MRDGLVEKPLLLQGASHPLVSDDEVTIELQSPTELIGGPVVSTRKVVKGPQIGLDDQG